jgi:hypothetical protein
MYSCFAQLLRNVHKACADAAERSPTHVGLYGSLRAEAGRERRVWSTQRSLPKGGSSQHVAEPQGLQVPQ